jgi:hypothetical protein
MTTGLMYLAYLVGFTFFPTDKIPQGSAMIPVNIQIVQGLVLFSGGSLLVLLTAKGNNKMLIFSYIAFALPSIFILFINMNIVSTLNYILIAISVI